MVPGASEPGYPPPVDKLPITLLTQRRAVDFCRVRSSLCLPVLDRR
ncbi:hypothetical protein SAMN05421854_1011305 [Amycolatopsis rubida]|uniref:Uncharacterized protein n=1 Tax=Amycolatopsis rubida TaxID=112413 RepID=A0A1I5FV48_9PSEU|nr:hypothetical protein SAMN05421854_1011305 [Amycolatopsis rubida]